MTKSLNAMTRKLIATAIIAGAASVPMIANAEDTFRMQVHPKEVSGTWELMHGEYDRAIKLLEIVEVRASQSPRERGPVLTDLCFAHTKAGNYATAERYCEAAVNTSFQFGIALNNRGVLRALQGKVEAASADFDAAQKRSESVDSARFNIKQIAGQVSEYQGDAPNVSVALKDV